MMNIHMKNRLTLTAALLWVFCLFSIVLISPPIVLGAEQIKLDPSINQKLTLIIGKSTIVETDASVKRLAFAEPNYVDVKVISPRQIYLIGMNTGSTNATIWGVDGKIAAVVDISVVPNITGLKEKIHEVLPEEKDIRVMANQDSVILSGTVSSASNLAQVLALAETYVSKDKKGSSKLINLLEVGGVHQVMLEVRVAEMSRTLLRRLGVNILGRFINGNDSFVWGFFNNKSLTGSSTIPGSRGGDILPTGIFDTIFNTGNVDWIAFVDALKENGLSKILAEPTLITTSGRPADFLAGGEFPIPVPNEDGITIEYKSYGVGLSFTPTVLGSGKISMAVNPEVSDIDIQNTVAIAGYPVPSLTTRRASTVIELADGQTFAIAGLLRDDITNIVSKFPVLGDIPILGALFRSTEFQKNETELVIIVTPHLVKPVDMAKQTLPTDQYVEPNDFEFYLLGKIEGNGETAARSANKTLPAGANEGGLEGDFGHIAP